MEPPDADTDGQEDSYPIVFTKTSSLPLESRGTKFSASEMNATRVPSGENTALKEVSLAWFPFLSVDTRAIAPVVRFFTKISVLALVSPETRLVALDLNATRVPSGEIAGPRELPLLWLPAAPMDMRVIAPEVRLFKKRSDVELVSPGTRFEDPD